ncbi:MAG: iron-sulfur cluster assembly accessory protein, partial [Pseudomonadota bacterium]
MSDIQFNSQITDEISVSPEAAVQLRNIIDSEDNVAGIRIFVHGGGCSGMSYGMTLVEQPHQLDCTWEDEGLKVFVDTVALGFLEGVEIDFRTEGLNQSFVFKNVFA